MSMTLGLSFSKVVLPPKLLFTHLVTQIKAIALKTEMTDSEERHLSEDGRCVEPAEYVLIDAKFTL